LEGLGIKPDIISGVSAGALTGTLYADGHTPRDIMGFFGEASFRKFTEFGLPRNGIFQLMGSRVLWLNIYGLKRLRSCARHLLLPPQI
jgi:NTE family protein